MIKILVIASLMLFSIFANAQNLFELLSDPGFSNQNKLKLADIGVTQSSEILTYDVADIRYNDKGEIAYLNLKKGKNEIILPEVSKMNKNSFSKFTVALNENSLLINSTNCQSPALTALKVDPSNKSLNDPMYTIKVNKVAYEKPDAAVMEVLLPPKNIEKRILRFEGKDTCSVKSIDSFDFESIKNKKNETPVIAKEQGTFTCGQATVKLKNIFESKFPNGIISKADYCKIIQGGFESKSAIQAGKTTLIKIDCGCQVTADEELKKVDPNIQMAPFLLMPPGTDSYKDAETNEIKYPYTFTCQGEGQEEEIAKISYLMGLFPDKNISKADALKIIDSKCPLEGGSAPIRTPSSNTSGALKTK